MSAVLNGTLNDLAGDWLPWALDRAIAAAIVCACVALVAWALRRWMSVHVLSWMWLIPLLPLVAPVERLMPGVETPVAPRQAIAAVVGVSVTAEAAAGVSAIREPSMIGGAATSPMPAAAPTVQTEPMTTPIGLPGWLFLTWATVALVLIARFAWNQWTWSRFVGRLHCEQGAVARRVRRLCSRSRVRSEVRVAFTDAVTSPATSGWRRPTILLPKALADRLASSQLDWVILHELAHVRRGDLLTAALQRLIQMVWWWHPVPWLANAQAERHRECACDDAASAHIAPDARRPCAEALFEVVAAASGAPTRNPALASLADHRSQLRRRLMRLLDVRRPVARGASFAGLACVVASALMALTVANAQEPARLAERVAERVIQESVPTAPRARAQEALRRAVAWLVEHQHADGHWLVGEGDKPHAGMETQVSSTARAILALNEADAMAGSVASRKARDTAVSWLEKQQDKDGCVGPRAASTFMYGHALATLALCSEQRRAKVPGRVAVIQKAIGFSVMARNPYAGWRYGVRDGDNDSQMTSLMLMGIREAARLGVDAPVGTVNSAEGYLKKMIDRKTGRVGWVRSGGAVGRLAETWKTHPPEHTEEVTALAIVGWLDAGRDPARDADLLW